MAISRNQQHFIVTTVIYNELVDFVMGKGETFRNASEIINALCINDENKKVPDFVIKNVSEALNHYGEIVKAFEPHLVDWKWDRLPLLSQAILLKSYAHYFFVEEVDKNVVINIAVVIAKKYIEPKQAKFINAILDEVLHK